MLSPTNPQYFAVIKIEDYGLKVAINTKSFISYSYAVRKH